MRLSPAITRLTMPSDRRADLYEGLAAYLDNKLNMLQAIALLQRHTPKGLWGQENFLRLLRERLAAGRSLPDAMRDLVPAVEAMILAGGDAAARQAEGLRLAAEMIRSRRELRRGMWRALAYPLLLAALFVVMLLTIALYVIPQLEALVPSGDWTGNAALLRDAVRLLASWRGALLGGGLLLGAAWVAFSLPYWTGPLRRFADALPPWSLYRLIQGSMWLLTLSTLLRGGVQMGRALETMGSAGRFSPWLEQRVEAVRAQYAAGKDIGRALLDTGYDFPDKRTLEEFSIYAPLPGFQDRLHDLTRAWLRQGLDRFAAVCRRLNTVAIIALSLLMLGVGLTMAELLKFLGSQSLTF